MTNKKYCFKCGEENPEYEVDGYERHCKDCGGKSCVLSVNELLDYMNEQYLRGLLQTGLIEDVTNEDYQVPELRLDGDVSQAEIDAYHDYMEDFSDEDSSNT